MEKRRLKKGRWAGKHITSKKKKAREEKIITEANVITMCELTTRQGVGKLNNG